MIRDRVTPALVKKKRDSRRAALHSSGSAEWGTPRVVVELFRYVLGGIDLDPATSSYFNHHVVQATRYFDRHTDGLLQRWDGRVLHNAPSETDSPVAAGQSAVRCFWEHLAVEHAHGRCRGAGWVGFSLEQLALLQGSPTHPLQWVTVVPCERLHFLSPDPRGGPPVEEKSPTHANYLTLLPDLRSRSEMRAQVQRFKDRVMSLSKGAWGAIVRPV